MMHLLALLPSATVLPSRRPRYRHLLASTIACLNLATPAKLYAGSVVRPDLASIATVWPTYRIGEAARSNG
jgi:hypothetical protein